ncbi:MAG TPA: hypothetical protein ACFYED_06790 [Candidatus Tripitaka californicus]|uniref:hypothetical protein n=1 Tax=Candidatus Tripitaka californicus TaxID=3367616 RepID=UPI0040261843|nr:hypothetical protein [Planctomycetota bacterium]
MFGWTSGRGFISLFGAWSASGGYRLRWISLVLLVPYLALTVGAEGLHRFSCRPHHHNLAGAVHTHPSQTDQYPTSASGGLRAPSPGPQALNRSGSGQGETHDADSCILCQWLKYSPQGLTPRGVSLVFTSSEFSDSFPHTPFQILSLDKKLSRAPPA